MRFIRAFWGDIHNPKSSHHKEEIQKVAETSTLDELVFVWGRENYNYITSLGFDCKLVSDNPYPYGKSFNSDFYIAKLDALRFGCMMYNEVIFLDWDTEQLKELDDKFYSEIKSSNSKILMPLYIYEYDYARKVLTTELDWKDSEIDYMFRHSRELKVFAYSWNNYMVTPNAGFVYCNDLSTIEELIGLCKEFNIQTCNEEMAMCILSKINCSDILDYIENYEPTVCSIDPRRTKQPELNTFIDSVKQKTSYFCHMF